MELVLKSIACHNAPQNAHTQVSVLYAAYLIKNKFNSSHPPSSRYRTEIADRLQVQGGTF